MKNRPKFDIMQRIFSSATRRRVDWKAFEGWAPRRWAKNGFRCPDDGGKVFHYHSLSNAVWNDEPANPFIRGNMPGKGAQKIEVGLKPISGRIVGTLLDAELADHVSRNLYDRDYATAEWLVEQGVPFYKEITRGNVKILIASQLPALPPGWKRPS